MSCFSNLFVWDRDLELQIKSSSCNALESWCWRLILKIHRVNDRRSSTIQLHFLNSFDISPGNNLRRDRLRSTYLLRMISNQMDRPDKAVTEIRITWCSTNATGRQMEMLHWSIYSNREERRRKLNMYIISEIMTTLTRVVMIKKKKRIWSCVVGDNFNK